MSPNITKHPRGAESPAVGNQSQWRSDKRLPQSCACAERGGELPPRPGARAASRAGGSPFPRGATAQRPHLGAAVPGPQLRPASGPPSPCRSPGDRVWRGERLNGVARAGPWPDGTGVLLRGSERETSTPAPEGRPQGAARRSPSASREERSRQTPNRLAPRPWTSRLQNCRK